MMMMRRRKRVTLHFEEILLVRCRIDLTAFLLSSAPKCGFIKGNEKIMLLLEQVKPEIVAFREAIIVVSFHT